MTRAQWIELIKRALDGGSAPVELRGRYHENEIALYIQSAINSLLNTYTTLSAQNSANQGHDLWKFDGMTKTYPLDIKFDSTRKKYYSELPVSIMPILNNSGIRMIFPIEAEECAFIPRAQTDDFLMDGLDVNLITGLIYFKVENTKVYYSGDINCNWKQVLAKLIINFTEFDDNDEVPMPEGKDFNLLEMVYKFMLAKKPMDNENDNVPIQNIQ